jgi:two-component system sensor histidine kinase KdpD
VRSERPDPDALLKGLQRDEATRSRGRLKVFLGASAGVGKTYAMLSEAHERIERGEGVLVGYVETHGRRETETLLDGLPLLPRRTVDYRGVKVEEFDLDEALSRRPGLILVDELAHTNAPGSRHTKRWQDVEELLEAGIDVHSAMNVQHLESLNDAVAQITGVFVKETVPDALLERADEIEVVDIPPEELRQRLREGKVYVPDRIEHALEGFFQTGNLVALRELALRRAADRVDAEMQRIRSEQGVHGLWPGRPRVVVCIAPNRLAMRVVRVAARLAAASHAQTVAVYVESDRQSNRTPEEHDHAREALRLAESLGIETVTLGGHDIASELLNFARRRNADLVVVGKPIKPRWRELAFGSVVDEVVRRSGEIDVHVITGEEKEGKRKLMLAPPASSRFRPRQIALTLAIVALATGVCSLLSPFLAPANLIMVYLLGVAVVASRFGAVEAVIASLASVLMFDIAFVPPKGTFAVSDTQYVLTFAIMLAVALLISRLTLRQREQAVASSSRERRTAALFSLTRQMAQSRDKREMATAAALEIGGVFETEIAILVPRDEGLDPLAPSSSRFEESPNDQAAALWSFRNNDIAGCGTQTLPSVRGLFLPLRGAQGPVGVLAYLVRDPSKPLDPVKRNFLETFASSLGLALERATLAKEYHEARVQAESERTRNALLSSISHDLRTPLTSIAGAASALVQRKEGGELAETIYQESLRLNLQVQNLLDMTRLQSGEIRPKYEWHSLEEIVGSARARTRELIGNRPVDVSIPSDLPLLEVDASMIEKLLVNLFENAATHTPSGTRIEVTARLLSESLSLVFADNGPGIPPGQEVAIFERFAQAGGDHQGLGLGLAICRAIMRLHKGRIWARNRSQGGAEFLVEFPKPASPPEVPVG